MEMGYPDTEQPLPFQTVSKLITCATTGYLESSLGINGMKAHSFLTSGAFAGVGSRGLSKDSCLKPPHCSNSPQHSHGQML